MATIGERIIAKVLAEAGRPLTAEQQAALDEGPLPTFKPPPPKPARLVVDHGRVIADATVVVSPYDPNWYRGIAQGGATNGEIKVVRRP
jgi:hypothetical protein